MRVSEKSKRILKRFASLNDHFLIDAPSTFIVFGEGKEGSKRSLVVEGYLEETFPQSGAYLFESVNVGKFLEAKTPFNPARKLGFFEQLLDAETAATFDIYAPEWQEIRRLAGRGFTHARFFQKYDGDIRVRVFDARKYFSRDIADQSVTDYAEVILDRSASIPFYFYVDLEILKAMPKDDYAVSVLTNEIVIFNGVEEGLTFYTRDQRLGDQMEDRLSEIGFYDDIRYIDPTKMTPTSNEWKAPYIQRR